MLIKVYFHLLLFDDISIPLFQSIYCYICIRGRFGWGAHIQINYDKNKIQINSITRGEWLVNQNQQPIFCWTKYRCWVNWYLLFYSRKRWGNIRQWNCGIYSFSPLFAWTSTLKITNTTNAVTKITNKFNLMDWAAW